MSTCPRCGSKYVADRGVWEELNGNRHDYYCDSCKNKFSEYDSSDRAKGQWLMTFTDILSREVLEIYRNQNTTLSVNQKTSTFHVKSGNVKVSLYLYKGKGNDSYSIFVKTPLFNEPFIIYQVKMNPELTELALKNSAMKASWRRTDFGELAFLVGKCKSEEINREICSFLVRTLGVGAEEKPEPGCYVATAVYGSYDCPQVWTLRRFRDYTLSKSWYGRAFIKTYYAISPTLVKWFGHTNWFKNMWRGTLDRMVSNLNAEGIENTPYQDQVW